ncbi:MAG TPA: hypothetical protein VJ904_10405 [Tichowtungia sp.]|nr:hypothetical protein [Tichowtungia sp.]
MLAGLLLNAFPVQVEEPVEHRFFICGWASGGPAIYNETFEPVWHHDSDDEISDGWVLPDGGVVYSFSRRKQGVAGVVRLGADR